MTQKADNGMMDRILGKQTPAPNSTVSPAVANMAFDISIHEILEFSGNPRIYENPMFQSIKESIREPGVLRRLVVTRPPRSWQLRPLSRWNFTASTPQRTQQRNQRNNLKAQFVNSDPWTDDLDLMIGHFVENDLRGNLNWHE